MWQLVSDPFASGVGGPGSPEFHGGNSLGSAIGNSSDILSVHDIFDNSVHDIWEQNPPGLEVCEVLPGHLVIPVAGSTFFRSGASQQMHSIHLNDHSKTASSNNLQTAGSNNLQMYSEVDEEDVHDPPTDSEEDVSVWITQLLC